MPAHGFTTYCGVARRVGDGDADEVCGQVADRGCRCAHLSMPALGR